MRHGLRLLEVPTTDNQNHLRICGKACNSKETIGGNNYCDGDGVSGGMAGSMKTKGKCAGPKMLDMNPIISDTSLMPDHLAFSPIDSQILLILIGHLLLQMFRLAFIIGECVCVCHTRKDDCGGHKNMTLVNYTSRIARFSK